MGLQLLEHALAEIAQGVLIAGVDGVIRSANPAFARLAQRPESHAVGKTLQDLLGPWSDPATRAEIDAALAGGRRLTADLLVARPSGGPLPCRLTLSPSPGDDGSAAGFVALVEARSNPAPTEAGRPALDVPYPLMFDHVQAGIVLHDVTGALIYANPRAMELLGVALDEVKGALLTDPHWTFIREDGGEMTVDTFPVSRALATRATVSNLVIGIRKPGVARPTWVMGNAIPVFGDDGELSRVVVSFTDITALKETQQALALATERAEAATDAKSQFLANMSHEIRTPLTGVLGYARMLQDMNDLPAGALRLIEMIEANGEILLSTVNDVLDFSRLEADRVSFNYLPTDVAATVADALRLFELDAAKKRLRLAFELTTPVPPQVSIDANRLRQILINLVANAIKFTPTGSVTVALGFDPADATLQIEVRDTGIGIAPENLPHLFERFSQADISTTRQFGGAGLGLAICRYLAQRMGGRIGADSTLGAGSRFWFELPARLDAGDALAGEDPAAAAADGVGGARILVIDDNEMIRDLARRILEFLGLEVETAEDGFDGLARARAEAFDLFLIDRQMPGLGGESVAAQIRAMDGPNSTRPLIAFSADVIGDLPPVFDGAVSKPIDVRHLAAELTRHLAAPRRAAL